MRKRMVTAAMVAAGTLLAGCQLMVPSLHPLYEEGDRIEAPGLVGDWRVDDSNEIVRITEIGPKKYWLETVPDEDEPKVKLDVVLMRMAGLTFADFAYTDESGLAIPGHFLARIELDSDRFRIAPMKTSWLKEMLTEHNALPSLLYGYSGMEKYLAILAPTKELQYFLLRHAGDPEAFKEETTFYRVKQRGAQCKHETCY